MKRSIIDVDDLTHAELAKIFNLANIFLQSGILKCPSPIFVAPLFFEPSTRTTASFEIAIKSLGLDILNFSLENSSLKKGESHIDTIENLIAMGVGMMIIRQSKDDLIRECVNKFGDVCSFVNAGSGMIAHPTQALLDVFTLQTLGISFDKLKIAIVGDLKHSRVVRSLLKLFHLVGIVDYRLVSPEIFSLPNAAKMHCYQSLADGLKNVDVVMCLRVQKERFYHDETFNLASYQQDFCINARHFERYCPNAYVMHPGPMNVGVEIDKSIVSCANSLILKQVKYGVYVRAALMHFLLNG